MIQFHTHFLLTFEIMPGSHYCTEPNGYLEPKIGESGAAAWRKWYDCSNSECFSSITFL